VPNISAVNAPSPRVSIDTLASVVALVEDDMRAVEARLAERLESPVGAIPQVGSHLLGAGGKRLRPLLALLAARASGAPLEHALAVGCAAELIHTATLYHDDVVDDGRVRRGRPAARMVFGNGVVVLVSDFCLARARTVALTGRCPWCSRSRPADRDGRGGAQLERGQPRRHGRGLLPRHRP
jgi:octaprenyl-diphosphate synthase